MNRQMIEGKWRQFRGKVKERWARFRHDDLEVLRGKRDQLVGKVQEVYGLVKEKAEAQVAAFLRRHPEPEPAAAPVRRIRVRIVRVKRTTRRPVTRRRPR